MCHNSPHHWLDFIPCCFGGVQARSLGQTTSLSSGLCHPIVSPCALLASIVKHPTLRNQSDLPHRWSLALVFCLCRKTTPPPPPPPPAPLLHIREGFIHQTFWKIQFQLLSLTTTFLHAPCFALHAKCFNSSPVSLEMPRSLPRGHRSALYGTEKPTPSRAICGRAERLTEAERQPLFLCQT